MNLHFDFFIKLSTSNIEGDVIVVSKPYYGYRRFKWHLRL